MDIVLDEKTLSISNFLESYRDKDFLEVCKVCYNYNMNWSCPPLDFDLDDYFLKYKYINLIGIKIKFSEKEIKDSMGKDIANYSGKILKDVKNKYTDILLNREKNYSNGRLLLPGSCSYCDICKRREGIACLYPEKLRYSMDSFGFNLNSIAKMEFAVDLLWGKDSLPKYYFLIFGLMY